MNIIIDQGNSAAKVALFDENALVKVFHTEALTEVFLDSIIQEFKPEAGILCSVKNLNEVDIAEHLKTLGAFYQLDYQLPIPLTIEYQTPQTLGMDRVAAAVGGVSQKPATNLLVIDIGTAITIDYVSATGVYRGGNISPGVELRFKALSHFTGRLPFVHEQGDIPSLGYNTETAIRSGVIEGITRELDSYIDEYQKKQGISTFLTGGYTFYFESKLKNAIFADENLVLKGLNEILKYQQK
ncbi:MAG: type III pantothenate kinase [Dysgonamonadaceae bacterium]|jgi:type III pantothenate kinase|nr:type III pantothenate kinase [Dysgonamonadaceae bacterium]